MGCQADSSWLIALLDSEDHHHSDAVAQFERLGLPPVFSALVLGELLSSIETRRREKFKRLSEAFEPVIPVSAEIAAKGAEIRVEYRLSLSDAIVVASALVHDTELLTFDKKMQSVFERLK